MQEKVVLRGGVLNSIPGKSNNMCKVPEARQNLEAW